MRKAKGENEEGLFSREEWLTKAQRQGFFFRLSSSRWRRAGSSPNTAVDDKSNEELIDEEEVNQMTTVESVVTEIGLTHPIVYDIVTCVTTSRSENWTILLFPCLRKSVLSSSSHLNGSRAKAWGEGYPKIRSRRRSLFSRPFACICIYNVISVVHQKISLLIKLFVVVAWKKKSTRKLQMKRMGFSDKRSHRIKKWAETNIVHLTIVCQAYKWKTLKIVDY